MYYPIRIKDQCPTDPVLKGIGYLSVGVALALVACAGGMIIVSVVLQEEELSMFI